MLTKLLLLICIPIVTIGILVICSRLSKIIYLLESIECTQIRIRKGLKITDDVTREITDKDLDKERFI